MSEVFFLRELYFVISETQQTLFLFFYFWANVFCYLFTRVVSADKRVQLEDFRDKTIFNLKNRML